MSSVIQEIHAVLQRYNPWWTQRRVPDLPTWRRAAFREVRQWLGDPPAPRAILLSGTRQVGKTTILLQAVQSLLEEGIAPERILYATFDHPLLKLAGVEGVLNAWREVQVRSEGTEYLLLDEIQYNRDWQIWLKHQVDFEKRWRIVVTGSVIPLNSDSPESGVGRWHTIVLPTLSFLEYLQIRNIELPPLPVVSSLADLFAWSSADRIRTIETARPLVAHFHEYLIRGGFPQTALVDSVTLAQRLLREDIVDKVLKRDMTAFFGVRRVLELEKLFLYLCMHDGGIVDVTAISKNLAVKRPTVTSYLDLLEAAHLIHRLPPYGFGKEILRARYKVYMADPAITGSVLLKGRALLDDGAKLGAAVEAAVYAHVLARYASTGTAFYYWRGKQEHEVDVLAENADGLTPFEVKYSQARMEPADLKGLRLLCQEKDVSRAYVITRDIADLEVLPLTWLSKSIEHAAHASAILRIPAPLACYWLSQTE